MNRWSDIGVRMSLGKRIVLSFLALALLPSLSLGQVNIEIIEPEEGAAIGDTFTVSASVTSTYEVTRVYVEIEGTQTDLVYSSGEWTALVTLIEPVSGPYHLVVKGIDAFDNTASDSVGVVLDYPPVLIVEEPTQWSIARPTLWVKVQCLDDDPAGCASIEVIPAGLIVEGVSSIDQEIKLPSFDGIRFDVRIIGTDTAGQSVYGGAFCHGDFSKRLTEVVSVRGRVLDADAERVLYVKDNVYRLKNYTEEVFIHERSSGVDSLVVDNFDFKWGKLTSLGAIALVSPAVREYKIVEYRSGQLIDIEGKSYSECYGFAAGDYLVYISNTGGGARLRNIVTQTDESVPGYGDVAINGDVVFIKSDEVFRYRGGETEQITHTETDGIENRQPVTDGINVVYTRVPFDPEQKSTWLYNSEGESVLLARGSISSYAVNNGWVAFVRTGQTGVGQVWVRSPDGFEEQISFFSRSSTIETMAPNGEVMFFKNEDGRYSRYLGIPRGTVEPEPAERINWHWTPQTCLYESDFSYYQDGQWYVVIGRTVFAVTDEPVIDGGVEDGEVEDGEVEDGEVDDGEVEDGEVEDGGGDDDTSEDGGNQEQANDEEVKSGGCAGCNTAGGGHGFCALVVLWSLLILGCRREKREKRGT